MSALKELLRVVGAWEDDIYDVSIELRGSSRKLWFALNDQGALEARTVEETIEVEGDRAVRMYAKDDRPMMSPEDVRSALRWFSTGGAT